MRVFFFKIVDINSYSHAFFTEIDMIDGQNDIRKSIVDVVSNICLNN